MAKHMRSNDLTAIGRHLRWPIVAVLVVIGALALSGRFGAPSPTDPSALAPSTDSRSAAPDASMSATEEDIAKYYALVQENPDTVDAYVLLGSAYVQHVREVGDPADYGRAEAAFAEALQRDPDNVSALVGKGALALARHEFREALEIGQQAISIEPNQPGAYGLIADAQTELGMYEEAVGSLQTMVDLRPDLASYSRVSYQRELRGQIDPAIEAMEAAYRAGGMATENTEYVRVLMGNLHFAKGDLETAEAIFQASLDSSPDFVWALSGLARVRAAEGELDEAIDLYQRAVDQIPLPEFVIALGETQEAAGLSEVASDTYELVEAIQALFEANGVNTDLDLALFTANHGDEPDAAVELARAAYEDQPSIKAADALGWALFKADQLDEAERYAEEALRLGTRDGLFLYHAGMIAKARGDLDTARARLSEAFEVNPHFSPLYEPRAQAALDEVADGS